jgi:hypothetical protein
MGALGAQSGSANFEYDATWLANLVRFALGPALILDSGPKHTRKSRALFGASGAFGA